MLFAIRILKLSSRNLSYRSFVCGYLAQFEFGWFVAKFSRSSCFRSRGLNSAACFPFHCDVLQSLAVKFVVSSARWCREPPGDAPLIERIEDWHCEWPRENCASLPHTLVSDLRSFIATAISAIQLCSSMTLLFNSVHQE